MPHDRDSPPAVEIHLSPALTEKLEDGKDFGGSNPSTEDRQMAAMLRQAIDGTESSLPDRGFHSHQTSQFRRAMPGLRGGQVTSPKKRHCSNSAETAATLEKRQKTTESEEEEEFFDPEHQFWFSGVTDDDNS